MSEYLEQPEHVAKIELAVTKGRPLIINDYMAVAMIDISGYTALTSKLSAMGKIASELLTQTVGSYIGMILNLVTFYNGDVVKFLGDAVLVTFSRLTEDEDESVIVTRALQCCIQVMRIHSEAEFKLDSIAADVAKKGGDEQGSNSVTLKLHIGMTAGNNSRVIMGNSDRMDYVVFGPCFEEIGPMLEAAQPGEISVSLNALTGCLLDAEYLDSLPIRVTKTDFVTIEFDALDPIFALMLPHAQIKKKRDASNHRVAFTSYYAVEYSERSMLKVGNDLISRFINQSLLNKLQQFALKPIKRSAQNNDNFNDTTGNNGRPSSALPNHNSSNTANNGISSVPSEFRRITVIFIKLEAKFEPGLAQEVFCCVLEVLKEQQGTFQQYSVDDKGQTLLMCFGLPPWTHDNEPAVALEASLIMSERLEEKGIHKFHIAVASGDILFATLGNSDRGEAALLGDVVNTSARLLGVHNENGNVVCDESTYKMSMHSKRLSLNLLGAFKLKGKSSPINVYGAHLQRDNSDDEKEKETIIGYVKERDTLADSLDEWSRSNEKKIVVLEGKPGSGKSTLLDHTLSLTKAKGISTILFQGDTLHQFTFFHSLVMIIDKIFQVFRVQYLSNDRETPEDILKKGSQSFQFQSSAKVYQTTVSGSEEGDSIVEEDNDMDAVLAFILHYKENPEHAILLKNVLPYLRITDGRKMKQMDGQSSRQILSSMLSRIICEYLSNNRLLLIFDDAQWLDEPSWEILTSVSRQSKNAFMLFVTRPRLDHKMPFLDLILTQPFTIHLIIDGLTLADIIQLTVSIFREYKISGVDEELAQAILNHSFGNPLLMNLIIQAMYFEASKLFKITANKTLTTKHGIQSISHTLNQNASSIILVQFDRLSQEYREILIAASCFGKHFRLQHIADINPDSEMKVEDFKAIIRSNDKFRFLETGQKLPGQNSHEDDDVYFFRNSAIAEAIYESISYKDRQNLNLKIAKMYESQLTEGNRTLLLPTISLYYSRSKDHFKSIQYSEELAMFYADRSMWTDAVEKFEKLFQAVEKSAAVQAGESWNIDKSRMAYWHGKMALACSFLRKSETAIIHLTKAWTLLKISWPEGEKDLKMALLKSLATQCFIWSTSRGGRRRLPTQSYVIKEGLEMLANKSCLSAIFNLSVLQPDYPKIAGPLAAVKYLNLLIRADEFDPVDFGIYCLRSAMAFSFVMYPLSIRYLKRGMSLLESLEGPSRYTFFQLVGTHQSVFGSYPDAAQYFTLAIESQNQLGLVNPEFVSRVLQLNHSALYENTSKPLEVLNEILASSQRLESLGEHTILFFNCHYQLMNPYTVETPISVEQLRKIQEFLSTQFSGSSFNALSSLLATYYSVQHGHRKDALAHTLEVLSWISPKNAKNGNINFMPFVALCSVVLWTMVLPPMKEYSTGGGTGRHIKNNNSNNIDVVNQSSGNTRGRFSSDSGNFASSKFASSKKEVEVPDANVEEEGVEIEEQVNDDEEDADSIQNENTVNTAQWTSEEIKRLEFAVAQFVKSANLFGRKYRVTYARNSVPHARAFGLVISGRPEEALAVLRRDVENPIPLLRATVHAGIARFTRAEPERRASLRKARDIYGKLGMQWLLTFL